MKPRAIYQLHLTLAGVTPPIWRRLQVFEDTTLPQLHRYVHAVMNWEEYHLHEFIVSGRVYADPTVEDDLDPRKIADERRVRLSRILKHVGAQLEYHYDFGDGWEHDVLLEAILLPEPGAQYPRCIAAARNAPPEDAGGPFGYENYLEALADRTHERHREMLQWRGRFDPEFCSLDLLNERLQLAAKSKRMPEFVPVYISPLAHSYEDRMEVDFSERERDLILNHSLADEHLVRDLGKSGTLRLPWHELDDLAGFVIAEARVARNLKLRQDWERIYEKISNLLEAK
jgi:hypothetical protein